MAEALRVEVPLVNPNEPEAWITAVHVVEGDEVGVGDKLVTVETTKSTLEVEAERAGFVLGLRAEPGATLRAGQALCWIANAPDWSPPEQAEAESPPIEGLRITEPARALAEELGLVLSDLPTESLITAARLRQITAQAEGEDLPAIDERSLLVYGGGGHGKAVIELVRALDGFELVGVVDDSIPAGSRVMGLEVLGAGDQLIDLRRQGIGLAANAVGGIGDIGSRVRVFERLRAAGFSFPTLVHPTAFVEPSASLAQGVQIFPQAYVGSEAVLGEGVIVNTAAVVSHDCILEDYVNIAPGTLLAGDVQVGERTLIGMGVTVNLSVHIGADSRVGNSAVIKADIPEAVVVRAGALWPEP